MDEVSKANKNRSSSDSSSSSGDSSPIVQGYGSDDPIEHAQKEDNISENDNLENVIPNDKVFQDLEDADSNDEFSQWRK